MSLQCSPGFFRQIFGRGVERIFRHQRLAVLASFDNAVFILFENLFVFITDCLFRRAFNGDVFFLGVFGGDHGGGVSDNLFFFVRNGGKVDFLAVGQILFELVKMFVVVFRTGRLLLRIFFLPVKSGIVFGQFAFAFFAQLIFETIGVNFALRRILIGNAKFLTGQFQLGGKLRRHLARKVNGLIVALGVFNQTEENRIIGGFAVCAGNAGVLLVRVADLTELFVVLADVKRQAFGIFRIAFAVLLISGTMLFPEFFLVVFPILIFFLIRRNFFLFFAFGNIQRLGFLAVVFLFVPRLAFALLFSQLFGKMSLQFILRHTFISRILGVVMIVSESLLAVRQN